MKTNEIMFIGLCYMGIIFLNITIVYAILGVKLPYHLKDILFLFSIVPLIYAAIWIGIKISKNVKYNKEHTIKKQNAHTKI